MIRLLLETATEVCSVALVRNDEVLAEVTATDDYRHASHLTLFIAEVLREAGLKMSEVDGVVLSDGPGSYTSLRIGAATAKGLCVALPALSLDVVPTLTSLAYAASTGGGENMIMATINSRRGEVYGQVFTADDLMPLTDIMNVQLTLQDWRGKLLNGSGLGRILVCGPGQERVREAVPPEDNAFRFGAPFHCTARNLCIPQYFGARDPAEYEPLYLNPPFVTKSKKKALL